MITFQEILMGTVDLAKRLDDAERQGQALRTQLEAAQQEIARLRAIIQETADRGNPHPEPQ